MNKIQFRFLQCFKKHFFVRERNNDAVRRSREKARLRQEHTLEAVRNLRKENEELENKKKLLIKELQFYKEMFKKSTGTWLNFLLEKILRSKMYILLGGYSCSLYDKSNFVCTFLIQEQQCCKGPLASSKQLYEIIIHWRSHPNFTCVKTKIYITGDSSFFYSKFKLSIQIPSVM